MKQWTCMIVDDEPVAIRVMKQYLAKMNHYKVVNTSTDALQSMKYLEHDPVDLLLLDIEMPALNGIQMFKTLENPPALILITAHREYAVEGFELNAVDYLMKPVGFPRFVEALNRFEETRSNDSSADSETSQPRFIFVTVDRRKKKINLDDIIYVESLKDYIRIITKDEKIITKETTKEFEQRLPSVSFLRIHRSFIVNINKIETVCYDEISMAQHSLPVGRSYKDVVMNRLGINQ